MLEDILRQIRALLQNQLPGKLDQIELERADGVALEDVQSFLIQVGSGNSSKAGVSLDDRQKHPSVIILGESTAATYATLPPSPKRELSHRISIWFADREVAPDSELPQTKLLRYVEAIERVLALDPSLGGKVMNSTIIGHAYPHIARGEFTRRAVLIMEVLERTSTSNY